MRFLCLTKSNYVKMTRLLPAHLAATPRRHEHLASNDRSQRHLTHQKHHHCRCLRCFIEQGCLLARLALAPASDAGDLLALTGSVIVARNLDDGLEIIVAVVGIELAHMGVLLQFIFSLLPAQFHQAVVAPRPVNYLPGHLSIATRKHLSWPMESSQALICGAYVKIMLVHSY